MHSLTASQQRNELRFSTRDPAVAKGTGEIAMEADAEVLNISANGLLIRMPATSAVTIGARLVVTFGAATVTGTVRHCTPDPSAGATVGLRIDDVRFG
jgi:hypothetical protein